MHPLKPLPKVSVVIPLHDEAACVEDNVARVTAYLEQTCNHYEVLLVDDGSTDDTNALCSGIVQRSHHIRLIRLDTNRGKGYAVRTGILNATGEYILFTDADLAVPIHFADSCLSVLEGGASVVIASRHRAESTFRVQEGVCRRVLGELFRQFAKRVLHLGVSDITCGFKGFTQKAGLDIFSRSQINRWGYDAEILFLAQRLGYVVAEIPVDWYHSFDSKVRVVLDSFRTFWEICRVRYNASAGLYDIRSAMEKQPSSVRQSV